MTAAELDVWHILSLAGRLPEDHADAVTVGLVELAALIGLHPRFAQLLAGQELTLHVTDRHDWDVLSTVLDGSDETTDGSDCVTHVRPFGTGGVFTVVLTAPKSVVEPEVSRG